MPYVFLDTSALIKLYVAEKGSNWLRNYVTSNQIVISELALFESATVLRRRYLEGTFTLVEASDLFSQIYRDRSNYKIISLGGEDQINRLSYLAFNLTAPLRVRALDGLHLVAAGIALEVANALTPPESLTFVSADVQLLNVAQSQNYTIENPENHP